MWVVGTVVILKSFLYHRWNICKISSMKREEILDAKFWCISKALKIVLRDSTLQKTWRIIVYLYFQMALK